VPSPSVILHPSTRFLTTSVHTTKICGSTKIPPGGMISPSGPWTLCVANHYIKFVDFTKRNLILLIIKTLFTVLQENNIKGNLFNDIHIVKFTNKSVKAFVETNKGVTEI